MIRSFVRWVKRSLRGNPCDRCGSTGAGLVVDAIPSGKKMNGATGLVTKTYTVREVSWLCPKCRGK